jgi:hypothetical protein
MITYEQREFAFEQANVIQKLLYDSYESGIELGSIVKEHKITTPTSVASLAIWG